MSVWTPLWNALSRWGIVVVVFATLVAGVIRYSSGDEPRSTVKWTSAKEYMKTGGTFDRAGFRIDCNLGGTLPTCAMTWRPPHNRKARPTPVYLCDTESSLSRDRVLLRFADRARRAADRDTIDESLAVLNAFFQSGLRREIDRAVHRARDHNQFANRLPPFELEPEPTQPQVWTVSGIDEAQEAIPTGLPRRPEYTAPVYARWQGAQANLIQVTARSGANQTAVWLNPAATRPCSPIFPGDNGDGDCNSVAVLACRGPECSEPVLNVRALTNGSALVTRASGTAGRLLSRTLQELSVQDMIVSDAQLSGSTTLYVKSPNNAHDVVVDITHDTSPPLSRLQMVNGRWTRWYEPSVQQWLSPVVGSMETFTHEGRVAKPDEPMRLALDLGLQRELDAALEKWMHDHAEAAVVADLRAHWSRSHRVDIDRPFGGERHHRAVPEAGMTVLDPQTGEILAVASYPPPSALRYEEGVPTFASAAWQNRLAGAGAPPAVVRQIAGELADRIEEDVNSNFVRHPIGSTIKPILLSLVMDVDTWRPQPQHDHLEQLFDLQVGGHLQYGGEGKPPKCATCRQPIAEPIAGLPLGPWGDEEAKGLHASDAWIDRRDFLLASCNKFAVTLGVLSLLDWSKLGTPNAQACCWLAQRDHFAVGGRVYDSAADLPPVGPYLDPATLATITDTAYAPIFQRLLHYYDVHAGSNQQTYDSSPWVACVNLPQLNKTSAAEKFVGRVETTQLALTSNSVTTAFTNIFTGSGRNWWTNVKLAEAYARIATNRHVVATFCAGSANAPKQFDRADRWDDLTGILSHQRMTASWVRPHATDITAWVSAGPGRMTASKTGTSLRNEGHSSTGIFAIYIGGSSTTNGADSIPNGRGLVVVAHVDDIGHSSEAVQLVNDLFGSLKGRLP